MTSTTAHDKSPKTTPTTPTTRAATTPSSSAASSALKRDLKGKDFEAGERALKPTEPNQKKGGPETARAAQVSGGKSTGDGKSATTKPTSGGKPTSGSSATAPKNNAKDPINKPQVETLDAAERVKFVKDLGKVASMQALSSVLGHLIGGLAPVAGTSCDASLKVAVFVEGFYIDLNLDVGAVRDDKGMELTGSMGIGLGVGLGLGAGLASGKAWAGIQGSLGFTSKADNTVECFELILLGLNQWMRNEKVTILDHIECPMMAILKSSGGGAYLADKIFGGGFEAHVLKSMDPKSKGDEADTLEFHESLGFDGGVDFEGGVGAMSAEGATNLNLRYEQTSTLAKNSKGQLAKSNRSGFAGDFGVQLALGKFSGAGSGSFFYPKGDPKNMEAEFALEIGVPGNVGALATQAKHLWDVWSGAVDMASGKLGDAEAMKVFTQAAKAGPRGDALAALAACGFVSSAVKLVFGIHGKERTFAIEVVHGADFAKTVGAGAAVAVEGDFTMGTRLFEKNWTVA